MATLTTSINTSRNALEATSDASILASMVYATSINTGLSVLESRSDASVRAIKGPSTAFEVETAGILSPVLTLLTALEVETAYPLEVVSILLLSGASVGVTTIESEAIAILTEMQLALLDSVVERAPTSLVVMVVGGQAQTDVTFDIDGTDVYTTSLDSEGYLGPTSINLSRELGTLGGHTITATQTTGAGVITASQTFTVLRDPEIFPLAPSPDADAVEVPGALVIEGGHEVRHWVLQDLLAEEDGGVGSYVLPRNPRNMTSPHHEHAFTARRTTAIDGPAHIFQAGQVPKEWQFTGICTTQDQQDRMEVYRYLNRRFYVIDHRNRAWKVIVTNMEFGPRLRTSVDGDLTDWASDYTVTITLFSQDWTVPV